MSDEFIKHYEELIIRYDKETYKLTTILNKIKNIIANEKITGIEARLMIKDFLEENEVKDGTNNI